MNSNKESILSFPWYWWDCLLFNNNVENSGIVAKSHKINQFRQESASVERHEQLGLFRITEKNQEGLISSNGTLKKENGLFSKEKKKPGRANAREQKPDVFLFETKHRFLKQWLQVAGTNFQKKQEILCLLAPSGQDQALSGRGALASCRL